jgi:hypothetical protein
VLKGFPVKGFPGARVGVTSAPSGRNYPCLCERSAPRTLAMPLILNCILVATGELLCCPATRAEIGRSLSPNGISQTSSINTPRELFQFCDHVVCAKGRLPADPLPLTVYGLHHRQAHFRAIPCSPFVYHLCHRQRQIPVPDGRGLTLDTIPGADSARQNVPCLVKDLLPRRTPCPLVWHL